MELLEFQENEVDEEHKDQQEKLDQPVTMDEAERTEMMEPMEPQVHLDEQEMPEMLETKVHMEPLEHQDLKEKPEIQDNQEQLVHEDLMEVQDNQEHEEQKDTKEQWDDTVCQDQLELLELQVTSDHQDHPDNLDLRDVLETLAQMEKPDLSDPLDHQEVMDNKETKDLLEQPETTEFQELPELPVHQDHQDHQETSATCCPEISGTQLTVEPKESLCTEANDPLLRTKILINLSQEVTNCSRTLPTSGRWSPTSTSNTRVWEPRRCQPLHAETCSNSNHHCHQVITGSTPTPVPPRMLCSSTATPPTTKPASGPRCQRLR